MMWTLLGAVRRCPGVQVDGRRRSDSSLRPWANRSTAHVGIKATHHDVWVRILEGEEIAELTPVD